MRTLVVNTAGGVRTDGLRLVVGLVAGRHVVRLTHLADASPWAGAEAGASAEVEAYLDALDGFGVQPERVGAAALRAALGAATRIVRLGAVDRAGTPAVLEVSDAWLAATSDDELVAALSRAGQVVRV